MAKSKSSKMNYTAIKTIVLDELRKQVLAENEKRAARRKPVEKGIQEWAKTTPEYDRLKSAGTLLNAPVTVEAVHLERYYHGNSARKAAFASVPIQLDKELGNAHSGDAGSFSYHLHIHVKVPAHLFKELISVQEIDNNNFEEQAKVITSRILLKDEADIAKAIADAVAAWLKEQ